MKKLLAIVLSFALMLTFTASAFATGSTTVKQSNSTIVNGFEFETLKASKKNGQIQKVRITNLETNEVEYLETYLVDEKYSYLATTKNGKIRTEPLVGDEENLAKITNLDTKEVKYLKKGDAITNKTAPVDSSLTLKAVSSVPFTFTFLSEYSGSNAASWSSVAAMASILMAISGVGVVPAGIFAAASTYIINRIETVYYHSMKGHATYMGEYYVLYQTWYYYDSAHNYFKEYTCYDTYTNEWQFR